MKKILFFSSFYAVLICFFAAVLYMHKKAGLAEITCLMAKHLTAGNDYPVQLIIK